MAGEDAKTFLVESYVPRLDKRAAAALSSRVRAAVVELQREGIQLQWLQSFALVDEETYACMLSAPDVAQVARVNERAGLRYDHVVEVHVIDVPPPERTRRSRLGNRRRPHRNAGARGSSFARGLALLVLANERHAVPHGEEHRRHAGVTREPIVQVCDRSGAL